MNWCLLKAGVSPQFPGVLVGPLPVRKCHQVSLKEHMQLGWVARWVLSAPPGHPTAGRCVLCVRVVPVLPLLLCTRPARARPSVGGESPTPAPRQLPWSPPRLALAVTALEKSSLYSRLEIETRDYVLPLALRRLAQPDLLANEVTGGDQIGVFRTPSKRKPTGAFPLAFKPHLKSQITSLSLTVAYVFPTSHQRSEERHLMGVIGHPGMPCRKYVRPLFRIAVPGDLNSRISQI